MQFPFFNVPISGRIMKEIHATFYIIAKLKRKQTICKCQNSKAEQKENEETSASWKIGSMGL